ncbi:hypothetical protein FKP32DRAFT_1540620, partial [Trametes sanguinea]
AQEKMLGRAPELCEFCDEPLSTDGTPFKPSAFLMQLRIDLNDESWPEPTLDNPRHRQTSHWRVPERYCQQHRYEVHTLPRARAAGWPMELDLGSVCDRVLALRPTLESVIAEPYHNEF